MTATLQAPELLTPAPVRSSDWLGRVLVACEYSGRVRNAFAALGWDAWSCDLLPSETPGNHIQDDVRKHLHHDWDIMVGHPECTRIANSGVRWLDERGLWDQLDDACAFFRCLLDAPVKHIALENPIPHKYALDRIGRKYDQIIQPWQHGHGETKATCLWLKNLPKLTPSNVVSGREQRIWKLPPSEDRWKERSRTFSGVAQAMANQWTLATRPNSVLDLDNAALLHDKKTDS
jgi:hypothetical protein